VHCGWNSWSKEGQFFWTAQKGGCKYNLTAYVGDVLVFRYSSFQEVWQVPGPSCPAESLDVAENTTLIAGSDVGGGDLEDSNWPNMVKYRVDTPGTFYFSGADRYCRGNDLGYQLLVRVVVAMPTAGIMDGVGGVSTQRLSGVVGLLQVPQHERSFVDATSEDIRNGRLRALDQERLAQLSAASQNVLLLEMSRALSFRLDALTQSGPLVNDSADASWPAAQEVYVHCFQNPWSKQGQNFWVASSRDPVWGCNNNLTVYVGDVLVFRYASYEQVWKIPSPECPSPSLADSVGSLLIGPSDVGGGELGDTSWPNVARYRASEEGVHYFVGRDETCNGKPYAGSPEKALQRLKLRVDVLPREQASSAVASVAEAASSKAVERLEGIVQALARTAAVTQSSLEQLVRTVGGSGITQVRSYVGGTEAYHEASYTSWGVAAVHDHANYADMAGIGEFGAVLNGVHFQTRHNDYRLHMPAPAGAAYNEVHPVPMPEVPPEVLSKATLKEQIEEMREWFKAWHQQDYRVRDYRPYFRPVLCYVEGTWITENSFLAEPFASHRHKIDADSWHELHDTMRYLLNSGRKNNAENIPFLPTAVRRMRNNDTDPEISNFEYRIACHPLKDDLPLSRFRLDPDLHSKLFTEYRTSTSNVELSRQARFELHPALTPDYQAGTNGNESSEWTKGLQQYSFIDELMEQIPGKDGYGANLTDSTPDGTCSHFLDTEKPLNVAYYSRYYGMPVKDAMGRSLRKRGFNDPHLWAARTTHARVSGLEGHGKEHSEEQRWSYAFPLEIIYLTPLHKWNPYNLPFCDQERAFIIGDCAYVKEGERKGGFTSETAYNGTATSAFYRTPAEFFTGANLTDTDPADTSGEAVGVLDEKTGQVRKVMASGSWTVLPEIAGLGRLRQRYPILPVHSHGGTAWKELKALEEIIRFSSSDVSLSAMHDELFGITLLLSMGSGHQHSIHIASDKLAKLVDGETVEVWSSQANGHSHRVKFLRDSDGGFRIVQCDGHAASEGCADGHRSLTKVDA